MNFPTHQTHRVDTSQLAHNVGVSVMPAYRPATHVDTASSEEEDVRETCLFVGNVVFIAFGVLAASAAVGYVLWRVLPIFPL